MTGTRTHVVVGAIILDAGSNDSPQFRKLVSDAAEHFTIRQVTGDAAYAGEDNFQAVAAAGGTGYLAFRLNATGFVGGLFREMYHQFSLNKEEYLKHYHRRSNIESVFSAVKRVYGDALRSKTRTAMKNEILAKLLCHNLSQLIHLMYELGIEPHFGGEKEDSDDRPHVLPFRRPG